MEPVSFVSEAPGPELLPVEELADCAATVLGRDGKTILSYGSGAGYTPLREFIADWFGVHPDRVVLTNGWLQGFSLLTQNLVDGRTVAVEVPTYDPALKVLLGSGASLISVVMDEAGMNTADLEAQLIQYARPAVIYTVPSFQNPTGWTMSAERRQHLVDLVAAQNRLQVEDILLVEDESYALTRFEGEPLPSLFDLAGKQTIFSSTFSATIAPGLRVGWFILPDALAGSFAQAASSTYITPVLLSQAVVYELVRRGGIEPHLTRLRAELRARRDAMLAAFEHSFPDATWSRPEGGYFVWLELPPGTDARTLLSRAVGVTATAGTELGSTANVLRLSYGAATTDQIAVGIERLAAAMY